MIEWLRWVLILALVAGAYLEGKRQGVTEKTVEVQAQAITDRDAINAELETELAAGKERDERKAADLVAMQESIEQLTARSGSIGAQMRSALNASSMGTCLLTPDVQRVRADAYEQARAAATAANQARGGG